MRRYWCGLVGLALAGAIGLVGCEFGDAVKVAQVSQDVYDSIADAVVSEIVRLVEVSKTRPLEDSEKAWLKRLNEFRPALDSFSATHNLYVDGLTAWQVTKQKPGSISKYGPVLTAFIIDGKALWLELKKLKR